MYEKEIKRIGQLVYGPERLAIGLAIHKVSQETGVSTAQLAGALRERRTAHDSAVAAKEHRRTVVPNRMITHMMER